MYTDYRHQTSTGQNNTVGTKRKNISQIGPEKKKAKLSLLEALDISMYSRILENIDFPDILNMRSLSKELMKNHRIIFIGHTDESHFQSLRENWIFAHSPFPQLPLEVKDMIYQKCDIAEMRTMQLVDRDSIDTCKRNIKKFVKSKIFDPGEFYLGHNAEGIIEFLKSQSYCFSQYDLTMLNIEDTLKVLETIPAESMISLKISIDPPKLEGKVREVFENQKDLRESIERTKYAIKSLGNLHFPNLETLIVNLTPLSRMIESLYMTDYEFCFICNLMGPLFKNGIPNITSLNFIGDSRNFSSSLLKMINSSLIDLESLSLENFELDNDCFVSLTDLAIRLKSLAIPNCFDWGDELINFLQCENARKLENLNISFIATDKIIESLSKMKNLRSLDLSYSRFTLSSEFIQFFLYTNFPYLEEINFEGCFSNRTDPISELSHTALLNLLFKSITLKNIPRLNFWKLLATLKMGNKDYVLAFHQVMNKIMYLKRKLKIPTELNEEIWSLLAMDVNLTSSFEHQMNFFEMHYRLCKIQNFTEQLALEMRKHIESMDRLSEAFPNINKVIQLLINSKDHPIPSSIDLSFIPITDQIIILLCDSPYAANIHHLNLSHTLITDKSLKYLTTSINIQDLRSLDISGCNVSNQEIAKFLQSEKAKYLTSLNLSHPGISYETIRKLIKNNRNIQFLNDIRLLRYHKNFEKVEF